MISGQACNDNPADIPYILSSLTIDLDMDRSVEYSELKSAQIEEADMEYSAVITRDVEGPLEVKNIYF